MKEELTEAEISKIVALLRNVIEHGHGEVTIRVVNGIAKFISVRYENLLHPRAVDKKEDQE